MSPEELAEAVLHGRQVNGLITASSRDELSGTVQRLVAGGASADEVLLVLATSPSSGAHEAEQSINRARIAKRAGAQE